MRPLRGMGRVFRGLCGFKSLLPPHTHRHTRAHTHNRKFGGQAKLWDTDEKEVTGLRGSPRKRKEDINAKLTEKQRVIIGALVPRGKCAQSVQQQRQSGGL